MPGKKEDKLNAVGAFDAVRKKLASGVPLENLDSEEWDVIQRELDSDDTL